MLHNYKKFNLLDSYTKHVVCKELLFRLLRSDCRFEFELFFMMLIEVNPFVNIIIVNSNIQKLHIMDGNFELFRNKVTQYLYFICAEIHTL